MIRASDLVKIASLLAFAPRQVSQAEGEAESFAVLQLLSRAIPEVRQTRLMAALEVSPIFDART